ncbi:MAG: hypothetical protein K6V73_00230 [Firmicutes bacterium]|nr:hypothetical protein [Bacillota bacterium]
MAEAVRSVGELCDRFAAFHHMEAADLEAFLGLGPGGLGTLAGASLPEERSPEYAPALAALAAQSGASAARLAQVVRVARLLR